MNIKQRVLHRDAMSRENELEEQTSHENRLKPHGVDAEYLFMYK